MHCPTCPNETLLMGERLGVALDYCPRCRGIWLAPGRLEQLLGQRPPQAEPIRAQDGHAPRQEPHGRDRHHGGGWRRWFD